MCAAVRQKGRAASRSDIDGTGVRILDWCLIWLPLCSSGIVVRSV